MADEATKKSDNKEVDKVEVAQPVPTAASEKKKSDTFYKTIQQFPVWAWVVIAIFGFFAVFGLMAAGYSAMHGLKDKDTSFSTSRRYGDYSLRDDQTGNGGIRTRGGMMGGPGGYGMMNDTNTTSTTRVSGVVTAVDGNTITVAGNGTTITVKVTDSTTYSGSSKPATVNDTITVFGTTSDNVLTATSVRLIRQ